MVVMRIQLCVSVIALAAASLVVPANPATAAALPVGANVTVTGRVTDNAGQPVANASVHGARTDRFALTDANGNYSLSVPSGTAGVIAAKEGYAFANVVRQPGTNANLQLTPQTTKPRGEYPRPDADRRPFTNNAWLSLNGTWSFDLDPSNVGITQGWFQASRAYTKAIQVPFPYQSLAAFGEQDYATDELYRGHFDGYTGPVWYRRAFTVPQSFASQRTRLRIGATNWGAEVWLDGTKLFTDLDAGDTEISVDLGALAPGSAHTLAIRVVTPVTNDNTLHPIGRRDIFGPTGGIWQSVWIEPIGTATLQQPRVSPNLTFQGTSRTPSQASATVAVRANGVTTGTVHVTLKNPAGQPAGTGAITLSGGAGSTTIPIASPTLWDINQPNLYTADVTLDDGAGGVRDGQRVTFGLRKIERKPPRDGLAYQFVWLNNRPIYIRGALDQGFNPWGHHTPTGEVTGPDFTTGTEANPERGSIAYDLHKAKSMGFNLVRAHVKVFEPAYYHWADRLGLLIWYEMPNSGRGITASTRSFQLYEKLLRAQLPRDRNHPSIVIWGLYNEGWGAIRASDRRLDPTLAIPHIATMAGLTRAEFSNVLVDDNSACCENGHTNVTDLNDVHNGFWGHEEWKPFLDNFKANLAPGKQLNFEPGHQQAGQPWLMSEITFTWGQQLTHMSMMRGYEELAGYIGVELSAIELENGTPLTYDRQDRGVSFVDHNGAKRGPDLIHRDDAVSIDQESMVPISPTATTPTNVTVPVKVSHFSDLNLANAQLRWKVGAYGADGRFVDSGIGGSRAISPTKYGVTDAGTVSVDIPAAWRSGFLWVWVEAGGQTAAESYVTFVDTTPRAGAFDPMAPTASQWSGDTHGELQCGPQNLVGYGSGFFEYQATVPAEAQNGGTLEFEASSAEAHKPLSTFPEEDMSGTNARKFPTRLTVSVDGTQVHTVVLPDDPFDPMGIAARHFGRYRAGLGNHYGYRVAVPLPQAVVQGKTAVTVRLASNGGGLRVFGLHSGDRGIAPRIVAGSGFGDVPAAVPTTKDRPGLSYTPALMATTANNGTAIVSITNDTNATITNVQARLDVPAGWTATPTGSATIASIPAAGFAHVPFTIQGPSGTQGTSARVTATAVWTGPTGQRAVQVEHNQRTFVNTDINDAKGVGASLSGDARADAMCVEPGEVVRAWRNFDGVATWGWGRDRDSAVVGTGFTSPERTRFADLDNDGKSEIISLETDGEVRAWKNVRGFGEFPWGGDSVVLWTLGTTPPERVFFADLSGDGRAELLVLEANGDVTGRLNTGGFAANPFTTIRTVARLGAAQPQDVYWADLNGDKRAEVMVHHTTGAVAGQVEAWYNANGFTDPPWGPPPSGGAASRIVADADDLPGRTVKFADLNGDGRSDVAIVQPDGRIKAWMNGAGFAAYPWTGNHQFLGTTFTDPARLIFG
jgi:hypothetical protein